METTSPGSGHKTSLKQPPSGLRRLSLAMLATDRAAAGFTGLSEGDGGPGHVLAAFKAAAPHFGLAPRLVHAVDWLFRFTQRQDWERGSRPIVWPSASLQRADLGLSVTQAKALNRHLVELGLVVMRDSPNGKRYGKRDRSGRIVEAYGFDLSPLGARLAEFRAVAEKGRAEREASRQLRRRATIARKALQQIMETAAELGLEAVGFLREAEEARRLSWRLAKVESLDVLALGVAQLERRQGEARVCFEGLLAERREREGGRKDVETDPKGPENRPHQYIYKPSPNPEQDTVIGIERSRAEPGREIGAKAGQHRQDEIGTGRERGASAAQSGRTERRDDGTVLKITPDELVRLAPRLKPYLAKPSPHWPEIVEAADWLRHDLGVSKPLWGDACLAMGREQAAIALAIVSTKPDGHFRGSPGGYFHGMVAKARTGELNLGRTIWGMRSGIAKPAPHAH